MALRGDFEVELKALAGGRVCEKQVLELERKVRLVVVGNGKLLVKM